jgi:hypothetical protein
MSRQFQTYLLPADAEKLMNKLKENMKIRIIKDASPARHPIELSSPVQSRPFMQQLPASSIKCYLVPDIERNLHLGFYANPDRWIVEPSSDAIEFSGCDFNGVLLLIGRFYFQTDLLVGNEIIDKSAEFRKWASTLFRLAKKSLHYDSELKAYVGENALDFRRRGGRFASFMKANEEPVYEPLLN